jgi:hypothetical protein
MVQPIQTKETLNMQTSPRATYKAIALVALIAGFASLLPGQDAQSIPSQQEIDELASKADQKIKVLQDALTSARQDIEKNAPDLWTNEMETISTARDLIKTLREKGLSAYRLVMLNITIDDISRASLLSVIVAIPAATALSPEARTRLAAVTSAELACYDISELLGHATLRLIKAEEDIINRLPGK